VALAVCQASPVSAFAFSQSGVSLNLGSNWFTFQFTNHFNCKQTIDCEFIQAIDLRYEFL